MTIKNFIIDLFNLEAKTIEDFEITNAYGNTFVTIRLKKQFCECPNCHSLSDHVKDYHRRTINHSILNGTDTTLVYEQRRMFCPACGKTFMEPNPFVMPGKRVSTYTILRIMDMLKDPRTTFAMVSRAVNLSVPTVQRIFDEHAGITLGSFPEILCIDEVYSVKFNQRVYACVLADFLTREIYDLLPTRRKYDLYSYFHSIPLEVRDSVRYVSMDMWAPYRDSVSTFFRNADICVDSFHVVSLVNRNFDSVRIRVMNRFEKGSDEYYLLKKYNWLLRKPYEKIDMKKRIRLYRDTSYRCSGMIHPRDLLNILLEIDPELETAYVIKEGYYRLNSMSTIDNVEENLDSFLNYIERSGIPEFQTTRKTMIRWKKEIINSFNTVNGRRISNGPIESVNSRINIIRASANGYRHFYRFRRRVLYSLSKKSTVKF